MLFTLFQCIFLLQCIFLTRSVDAKVKADELLYNMNEDTKNEKWVNKHLKSMHTPSSTYILLLSMTHIIITPIITLIYALIYSV